MSKSRNAPMSLLHRLGVAGPTRVGAFDGSGAPTVSQGTGAPSRPRALVVLPVLAATLAALAFTTASALAAAPEAYVTEVASSSATLHAVLDPEGASLSYHFEYGASTAYDSQTPEESAGEASVPVSVEAHLQGLGAASVYHYRVVATNAAHETFASADQIFTTQHAVGEFALPDGRQYEMVTPAEKEGALFYGGKGDGPEHVIQASVDGDAIVDAASQPTEAEPAGNPDNSISVLSTRGPGGWSSQVIAGPHDESAGLTGIEGEESRLFSEDLSHVVVQPFGYFTPLSPEASEQTAYLRTDYFNGNVSDHCEGSYLTSSSCYRPLVTAANTSPGTKFGDNELEGESSGGVCTNLICGPQFIDASPDLSHIVVTSKSVPLTSTPGSDDYEWSGGQLKRLPDLLAGQRQVDGEGHPKFKFEEEGGWDPRGVRSEISANGERVILESGLYEVATGETVPLPGVFQVANSDDSRIFLSYDGLSECEIVEVAGTGEHRCNLSNLAPSVNKIIGVSEDGSYVYFTSGEALAPGAVPGCNMYVHHGGVTSLVAATCGLESHEPFARVSPDGRWLAFLSPRSLTGYDNRDAVSGEPDIEVYLYHAETSPSGALEPGKLMCASCDPTGARPVGESMIEEDVEHDSRLLEEDSSSWVAAEVPGWTEGPVFNGSETRYQTRYLSDSGRLFFDSGDALVPEDVDGREDVYEYEPEGVPAGEHACGSSSTGGSEVFKPGRAFEVGGVKGEEGAGCVALISAGTSSEGSYFLDASETGGDVFFATQSQLASASDGGGVNVWDAHECTSASPCPTSVAVPPPCTTEASCKAPPTPQPSVYGLPSSATFSGPGNLAAPLPPSVPKKVMKKTVKCKKTRNGSRRGEKGKCIKHKSKKKAKTSNRRAK